MNRKIFSAFIFIAFLFSQYAYGQSSFIPKNLGKSINSVYDEINPVLTADGRTLYFVRVNHPDNTYGAEDSEDIWFSEHQPDGSWSPAVHLPSLNIARYNAILSISADGNKALINGIYNKNGTFWKKRGLSVSIKSKYGWGTPQKLKVAALSQRNRGLKSSGMMTDDGQYIVLSFGRWYNSKKSNLFYCLQRENGKYKRPRAIKALNSHRNEDTPFLQGDTKTLYFSSDRISKGHYDIYKTTRISDNWKEWNEPFKINDTINSQGWDAYFKTNPKGSWACFSSTTKSNGGADIFQVKLFEENPFAIVSGIVRHAKNKRPIKNRMVKVVNTEDTYDSVLFNPDSASYRVKLPLGKASSLLAEVENYQSIPVKIDLTKVREFTKMKQDLWVEPLPYVLLKGKLLDSSSGQPISLDARPRIFIEGVPVDYANIAASGIYSVKINHGKSYKISVDAEGYESSPVVLDLTTTDEYKEWPLDLYANEAKVATITGKIIDKKTGRQVLQTIPVSIRVEGMAAVRATIDSLAGTYELKLPLGSNYTISASAPNYYPLYEILDIRYENRSIKVLKDLSIVPIEVGQSIRLNNIFFETAKAKLKKESFPELDRVARFLKDNPDIKIEITGHTDNVGKAASNVKLSHARATAVSKYILSKGVSTAKIVAKGYGSTKPVETNKTASGRAQNRRVEFTILDK